VTAGVEAGSIAIVEAPRSNARRVLARFARNRTALIGLVLVTLFVLVAVFGPMLAPYDPTRTNWSAVRKPPSGLFWFGTDELGRDVFARLVYGARASLLAGVVSVAIAFTVGVPFGMIPGYLGGWIDTVVMRVVDALLAVPFLVLAIAFAAFLGPSLTNAMIAIGISTAPLFARLARGETLVLREEEFIEAARAIGAPHWKILLRHIFPNALPPLVVQVTLSIATAIIAEAALAFLGLGQQPPAPSWGSMLNAARSFLEQAPWMAIYPGVAIFLTVLGFNLLGDGLRDALDPKDE
jgi:ABC-type dipeptide/oligopeptide/nickel transport system permease subunit